MTAETALTTWCLGISELGVSGFMRPETLKNQFWGTKILCEILIPSRSAPTNQKTLMLDLHCYLNHSEEKIQFTFSLWRLLWVNLFIYQTRESSLVTKQVDCGCLDSPASQSTGLNTVKQTLKGSNTDTNSCKHWGHLTELHSLTLTLTGRQLV